MSLYHKIGRVCLYITNKINYIRALKNLKAEKRKKGKEERIKVGFICQYIPSWGKVEPIYRIMKEKNDFETYLICLPMGINNYKLDNPEDTTNDTYEYFRDNGYDPINALIGKNQWLDLEALELDYLFYTRPYNHYMPKKYSSYEVSKYTRVCVLSYAYNLLEDNYRSTLNEEFFSSVYFYFAECQHAMEINKKRFKSRHMKGIQRTECFGMPGLEDLVKSKDKEAQSWSFSKNEFRVMWTPRWTTDKAMGGSNFFMYKDLLIQYAKRNPDVDFLFRPHPLMFDNFIKTGEMKSDEVTNYKNTVEELDNVYFDNEKEYFATFWKSSVLVSDISSMMYEYFLTGNPIIYCASNVNIELAENAKELVKGCYVSYTEEETFEILDRIKNGNDPLKETRQRLIMEIFGENIESIPMQIVDAVRDDYIAKYKE